jgi:hypothetical protein
MRSLLCADREIHGIWSCPFFSRFTGESRYPRLQWVPAFAGKAESLIPRTSESGHQAMPGFRTFAQPLNTPCGWSGNEVRMRSGDPGPDRPRERCESPDLTIPATRCVPNLRSAASATPLPSFVLLANHSSTSAYPHGSSAVGRALWRGWPPPRLRPHGLPDANVPRAFREVDLPAAKGHRHVARSASAFLGSSTTPPHPTIPNLIPTGCRRKRVAVSLGTTTCPLHPSAPRMPNRP